MDIWGICEEITSKSKWFEKVFDTNIVNKWKQEFTAQLPQSLHVFDLAIKMLQTSAQGTRLLTSCEWDQDNVCDNCLIRLKKDLAAELAVEYALLPDLTKQEIDEAIQDEVNDHDWSDEDECVHPMCKCVGPNSSLEDYVDYHPDGVVDADLHTECKSIIAEIAANEPIDWHPGSNHQVRDIIHPSMYCYVKGVSDHSEIVKENITYQWLPSEFVIDLNGEVHVNSYINNVKTDKYPRFVPMIENVFKQFVPSLEQILLTSVRGNHLQVIVKVGQIILTRDNSEYPGGSWHIEGMPYEHIAATCIHYVDSSNNTDSFLEFRKPVIVNEENLDYPQSNGKYTTHHYGIEPGSHHNGTMNRYLGLIRCHEGASVVFPNTLQHKVKDFSLKSNCTSSLRTILAFFVIDPNHRIISTQDIPPQQDIFSIEFANHYRERLMLHRKFYVNELNEALFEREFSLCEH